MKKINTENNDDPISVNNEDVTAIEDLEMENTKLTAKTGGGSDGTPPPSTGPK